MEYEMLFADLLHEKLKDEIIGKVYVKIENDRIYVHIECYHDVDFEMYIDNFAMKLLHGYTVSYAVYEITNAYKRALFKQYFKQKNK